MSDNLLDHFRCECGSQSITEIITRVKTERDHLRVEYIYDDGDLSYGDSNISSEDAPPKSQFVCGACGKHITYSLLGLVDGLKGARDTKYGDGK